jgi:hypothetical protein
VDDLTEDLRTFLDSHPFVGDTAEVLVRSLLDILDLPLWKRRYELYAAWVLAELLASVRVEARLIPSEPGVLRFPFRPTRMAELLGCEHEVAFWSEVRTPLVDPQGKSRKGGVQPDYTVLVDVAEPDPEASVMEIECKQYRRAASQSFVAALADYARARPNALVILVNHGPLDRDRLVEAVPEVLRKRTDAIASFHPLNQPARDRFRELVDRQLTPLCPRSVLLCRLAWDRLPSDLDLHLFAFGAAALHHVSWENHGSLTDPPFAALAADLVQPGSFEELTVDRWLEGTRYALAVHAYTDDAPLASSRASVTIHQPDRPRKTLMCPERGAGRWWYVADIELGRNVVPVHELRDGPPA